VQTPLIGPAADGLAVGGRAWLRHAKAGELCERFTQLHLVEGDRVTETVPTYRGEGSRSAEQRCGAAASAARTAARPQAAEGTTVSRSS
jgi:hypothetical protein